MNGINVGDSVWFFWTDTGKYVQPETGTAIFTDSFYIYCGTIVGASEEKDYVHVYVDGDSAIYKFGYIFIHDSIFRSKHLALEAMMRNLEQMA